MTRVFIFDVYLSWLIHNSALSSIAFKERGPLPIHLYQSGVILDTYVKHTIHFDSIKWNYVPIWLAIWKWYGLEEQAAGVVRCSLSVSNHINSIAIIRW